MGGVSTDQKLACDHLLGHMRSQDIRSPGVSIAGANTAYVSTICILYSDVHVCGSVPRRVQVLMSSPLLPTTSKDDRRTIFPVRLRGATEH